MSSTQVDYKDNDSKRASKHEIKKEKKEARREEKKEKRERKHEKKMDKIERKIEKYQDSRPDRSNDEPKKDVAWYTVPATTSSAEPAPQTHEVNTNERYYLRRVIKDDHHHDDFSSIDPSKIPDDITFSSVNPDDIPSDISLGIDPSTIPDQ